MKDMMNPRRRGDRNGDGVADDNYKEAPVFNDDQYEDVIEKEEGFVNSYLNFQEDKNNMSFSGVVLGVKEESMPVYDTDIEDVIEEEEGFVGKGGFGEEEENMEDVVVVTNDLCNLIEVSILIGKIYHEEYLKDAPMDDKLGLRRSRFEVESL
ncbi:hypothetical protein Tco_1001452 [Tanacetum coccineum]